MHQHSHTSRPLISTIHKRSPLTTKVTASKAGIDGYKLARLMVFAALAVFWVIVLRAVF